MKFLCSKKFLLFVGGVVTGLIGNKLLASKTVHKMAVHGLAAGIKIQKDALEKIQNIKEEADDLYTESLHVD